MSEKYPGIGNRLIICDVCGFKFRVKDTVKIIDRYNTQNQLIVCKADADKANPQLFPFKLPVEKLLSDPTYVRVESDDLTYVDNPLSDTLPSAPRNLSLALDSFDDYITLTWQGPDTVGSSPLLGYVIQRATPQLSYNSTIYTSDIPNTIYKDTSADLSSEYTYKVAAYSELGIGAYSDFAFWPTKNVTDSINYLVVSQDNSVLTTGDGVYFIL